MLVLAILATLLVITLVISLCCSDVADFWSVFVALWAIIAIVAVVMGTLAGLIWLWDQALS